MQRYNPVENVLNVHSVRTLQIKWSYTTGGNINASPSVANGVVFIGSWDYNVYAFNASTGVNLWSFPTGGRSFPLRPRWQMEWSIAAHPTAHCTR